MVHLLKLEKYYKKESEKGKSHLGRRTNIGKLEWW